MDFSWASFEETIARLYKPLKPDDGEPESVVAEAERRLDIHLPRILRDYYLLAGRRKDLNHCFDSLKSPGELAIAEDALVFYEANQGVAFWGIRLEDATHDDPPVVRAAYVPKQPLKWAADFDQTSDFLVLMLYWQAVNDGLEYVGLAGDLGEDIFARVQAHWPPVELGPNHSGLRVFSKGGQVLCVSQLTESLYELQVAGRTEEDFREILHRLKLKWDLLPDAIDDSSE